MNTTKEQNMISMTVGNPTYNAYVRIENINCPRGPINEYTRKINAIKATSNLAFLAGLVEAKNFVESFLDRLNEAYDDDKPMTLTSDTLRQDELEMIVAVIMFNTPCRYDVYYRP